MRERGRMVWKGAGWNEETTADPFPGLHIHLGMERMDRGDGGMEGDGGGMVPLTESARCRIQTGQVKDLKKFSKGKASKLKILHSVMGDRIPNLIWWCFT